MLTNTFQHIPGIGEKTEQLLWNSGVTSWDRLDVLENARDAGLSSSLAYRIKQYIPYSWDALRSNNPGFFAGTLVPNLWWRLFPHFRGSIAYLDIETTGLSPIYNDITSIAVYDGEQVSTYVYGNNLEDFLSDIGSYSVLVTFNGKRFDIPFIEQQFSTRLDQVHIDLMFVLRSLGYSGGLKRCEKLLGLDREELDGVDGYFAVLLWRAYQKTNDERFLETLLAYNVEDVLNLEKLLFLAYKKKIESLPFPVDHGLTDFPEGKNPFNPNLEVIDKLRFEA